MVLIKGTIAEGDLQAFVEGESVAFHPMDENYGEVRVQFSPGDVKVTKETLDGDYVNFIQLTPHYDEED